jgi:hypothetical protein
MLHKFIPVTQEKLCANSGQLLPLYGNKYEKVKSKNKSEKSIKGVKV